MKNLRKEINKLTNEKAELEKNVESQTVTVSVFNSLVHFMVKLRSKGALKI